MSDGALEWLRGSVDGAAVLDPEHFPWLLENLRLALSQTVEPRTVVRATSLSNTGPPSQPVFWIRASAIVQVSGQTYHTGGVNLQAAAIDNLHG